jgi:hypothetical protein
MPTKYQLGININKTIMTKFNFGEAMEKAEKDFGLGGDYFKVKDGDNKIRLLTPFIPHQSEFKGQVNVKFVAFIWDYKDSKVKPYFMPRTIVDEIAALQSNPEYAFDELPMPYDITISAKNAGTKEVKYSVVAARQNTGLTSEQQKALEAKGTVDEYIQTLEDSRKNQTAPLSQEEQLSSVDENPGVEEERIPL